MEAYFEAFPVGQIGSPGRIGHVYHETCRSDPLLEVTVQAGVRRRAITAEVIRIDDKHPLISLWALKDPYQAGGRIRTPRLLKTSQPLCPLSYTGSVLMILIRFRSHRYGAIPLSPASGIPDDLGPYEPRGLECFLGDQTPETSVDAEFHGDPPAKAHGHIVGRNEDPFETAPPFKLRERIIGVAIK